ncbi:D-alanine--D-alanine ligase family protein [Candidatus Paracaedibacter symbiosus]|uniref:D-alanine--D-alanine ligase family protein n=1 Tax=Candidatus Paracaedibacter symbiosus TaxID=244582 RepID=UPI00068F1E9B|nr:D-alanine--D-alanine ligase family protein [Candidatus Paracaedibacter symbiosus]
MKRLLILCGGKSAEHEISLKTAKNILKALDRSKFMPILVAVSRSGTWYYFEDETFLEEQEYINDVYDIGLIASLVKFPAYPCLSTQQGVTIPIDIALPIFHGPNGEDGTIQGLLDLCDVPYVGSGVMASAIGMDKDIFKQILGFHNIPVTPSITLTQMHDRPTYTHLVNALGGQTFFIKPACMGSSVGVSKVKDAEELDAAIDQAFHYSHKVLIEKGINVREIECAVLGNLVPQASVPGEICPTHDFYSYEAKYIDPEGAGLVIPAMLDPEITKKIQELSLKVF